MKQSKQRGLYCTWMCESELYAATPCYEIHLYSNPSVYRCVGITTVDVRVCGSPGRDKDKREGKSPSSLLIKKENTSRTRLRDSTNTSERHRRHVLYEFCYRAAQHNTLHTVPSPHTLYQCAPEHILPFCSIRGGKRKENPKCHAPKGQDGAA